MAIGNLLAGPAEGGRRQGMNTGIPAEVNLTQEVVQRAWGEAFDHLGQRALARIISCGGVAVDGHFIPAKDIVSVAVKLVTYNGTAKYHDGTKLISYARLPDTAETYQRWIQEGYNPPTPPAGEGWWPVVSIRTRSGLLTIQKGSGKKELIICFYQLQGLRLRGWWVAPEELEDGEWRTW